MKDKLQECTKVSDFQLLDTKSDKNQSQANSEAPLDHQQEMAPKLALPNGCLERPICNKPSAQDKPRPGKQSVRISRSTV